MSSDDAQQAIIISSTVSAMLQLTARAMLASISAACKSATDVYAIKKCTCILTLHRRDVEQASIRLTTLSAVKKTGVRIKNW